jgi:DNA-directed RNA polymerase specialized sigma24 family protein
MNAAAAAEEDRELFAEVGDCVRTLVLLLAPPHRDVLMLVELGGVSVVEAARVLELNVAQTRVRLHHARAALRTLLALSCAACPHAGCVDCSCEGCAAVSGGQHACG